MLTVAATQLLFQLLTALGMKIHVLVNILHKQQVQIKHTRHLQWVCKVQQKVKTTQDTQDTLTAAFTHSPALRLWGKLLVKCKREAKKGATVSQLVQRVGRIQVKAPHWAQKGQQSPEEGSPRMRGRRWEGDGVGCHSKVQSKFSSRREQGRFLLWLPES